MLANLKRRSSLYTLPIVIVIGFSTVAGLAAWQRSDVINELIDQIAHGEKADAAAAVRQLAAISNPPLEVLVDAASSDERATAEAAQVALNRLLSQWKQQLDDHQRTSRISAQLTELAKYLATQRRAFTKADYPWLAGTTHKIMTLANSCPAKRTPLVAMHCDQILAAIDASETSGAVRSAPKPLQPSRDNQQISPAVDSPETSQQRLEREFSRFPAPPMDAQSGKGENATSPKSPEFQQLPRDEARAVPNNLPTPVAEHQQSDAVNEHVESGKAGGNETQTPIGDVSNRPGWSLPMLRMQPKTSTTPSAADNLPRQPKPLSAEAVSTAVPSESVRSLMERWLAAYDKGKEADRTKLEASLAARGFKLLPEKLVRAYVSADDTSRPRIIDRVFAEPKIDSRLWLALLAEDENAEVRLAAVTMMATSSDAGLVEKAWQVSIRDRDPRIADLASRIHERRDSTIRR